MYSFSAWESSGVNCYEDGIPEADPGQYEEEVGPTEPDEDPGEPPICASLRSSIPSGCNVASPPSVVVDGCTGVPAALIVNAMPVASLGAIFTQACNNHDRCYSVSGASKSYCDSKLGEDMYEIAEETIPSNKWPYYEPFVRIQANAYASSLYNNFLWLPQALFNAAQKEASCRAVASAMQQAGCVI